MCLFYCLSALLTSPGTYAATNNTADPFACPAPHIDRQAKIKYVHDGDTVTLDNGEKIRLIGINAPELARPGEYRRGKYRRAKKAEPYGNAARDYLQKRLPHNTPVKLQYGSRRKDHYGRSLAHLFLRNGKDIQLIMLQQGLASALMIPPDTLFARCYRHAERQARHLHKGLWASKNSILHSRQLKSGSRGFHLVAGKVTAIRRNRQGIWIHLGKRLTLGIRPADQPLFDKKLLASYLGKTVLVRGWLNPGRQHTLYMRIRHPLSIELLSKTE